MIIDARSLLDNQKVETDVCIVGAGTAGITLAKEFIDKEFRVCILESGGLKPDPETQSLAWGENVGHPYYSLDTAYARFFGGTINRWMIHVGDHRFGARMRPLDPIDFEERDWVPYSGWPFDKSHLDPFYERAQKICKIGPSSFDVKDWEDTKTTPQLRFFGNRVKTVIFKFGLRDPFLNDYLSQVKGAPNITTYLYANVIEIEADETARNVTRLQVACLNGIRFSVSAKLFILAAGAIETPRLLLLSNTTQSSGLGNQYDLVGRFFMEHPHYGSGIFIPSTPEVFRLTGLYDHINRINGVPILGKLALTEETLRREKLLNYVAELVPRVMRHSSLAGILYIPISSESVRSFKTIRSAMRGSAFPEELGRHLKNMAKGMDEIAKTAYRNIKRKSLKTFQRKKVMVFRLFNMSEQVPNPRSRVTLASEKDRFGKNSVRLDWRLSPVDMQSAIRSQEILGEEFSQAGLGRLHIELNDETPPQLITGGWHQMGTTRMHRDPKKGVVDENCRVHGTSNLYISGPSVFPTSGYANPVLTIVALAVKLADHVKKLLS